MQELQSIPCRNHKNRSESGVLSMNVNSNIVRLLTEPTVVLKSCSMCS